MKTAEEILIEIFIAQAKLIGEKNPEKIVKDSNEQVKLMNEKLKPILERDRLYAAKAALTLAAEQCVDCGGGIEGVKSAILTLRDNLKLEQL